MKRAFLAISFSAVLLCSGCIKKNPMVAIGDTDDTATETGSSKSASDVATDSGLYSAATTDTQSAGDTGTSSAEDDSADDTGAIFYTTTDNDSASDTPSVPDVDSSIDTATGTSRETATAADTASDSGTAGLDSSEKPDTDSGSEPVAVTDVTAPTVVSVSPGNGETGVVADTQIIITFSEPMDQVSVENGVTLAASSAVDVSFSWDETGTVLTIVPTAGLVYETGDDLNDTVPLQYTVIVESSASDLAGNSLDALFVSGFKTLRRIVEVIPVTSAAYYNFYILAIDEDYISHCGSADDIPLDTVYSVGEQQYSPTSSTPVGGLANFETEIPEFASVVENAKLSASQQESLNDFYGTGGEVVLEQLVYQNLDATAASEGVVLHTLGTFCSTETPNPELDITETFAEDIANGDRDFLFRIVGITDELSAAAQFQCDSFTLTVQYLVP